MSTPGPLQSLANLFGIESEYVDLAGNTCATTNDSLKALIKASGCSLNSVELENNKVVLDATRAYSLADSDRLLATEIVLLSDKPAKLMIKADIDWCLESIDDPSFKQAGSARNQLALPALPAGVYSLQLSRHNYQEHSTVIASPAKSPSLKDLTGGNRCWGMNAALYGLESARSIGLGDFIDLAQLASMLGHAGAAFVGTHPLHALGWESADVISPYSPSHRAMLSQQHIALDAIPGLESSLEAKAIVEQAKQFLGNWRSEKFIDYSRHRMVHQQALLSLFQLFQLRAPKQASAAFRAFKESANQSLQDFVLYECISKQQGADWRQWPAELKTKQAAALAALREDASSQSDFHYWCQWLADQQLANAANLAQQSGMKIGLYLDLAVGARRDGAESWCEQDAIASGVSVGAPPDHLSPAGQNWQLSAFAPSKLRALQFQPFRQMLRAVMKHAGVLRIDHVLGLSRSFWIPDDGSAGGYIKQPLDALLAIVKIEAAAAGTLIIGEDLGLVPAGFRKTIRAAGFYGYSVWQYEHDADGAYRSPDDIEEQTLFCFATHDTPTVQGYKEGTDIQWWKTLDWISKEEAVQQQSARRSEVETLHKLCSPTDTRLGADALPRFAEAIHAGLAHASAALVNVQLDDVLKLPEAQNLPGTINEHPNWRRRYGSPLESIAKSDEFAEVTATMRSGNRASKKGDGGN